MLLVSHSAEQVARLADATYPVAGGTTRGSDGVNEASLGPTDLAIAGALLLASAGLSLVLGLGLARTIVVAAIRTMLQLTLVGYVLGRVFAAASPGVVFATAAVMMSAATYEIAARQERPLRGVWRYGLGGASMAGATVLVVAVGYATNLRPAVWCDPRVLGAADRHHPGLGS